MKKINKIIGAAVLALGIGFSLGVPAEAAGPLISALPPVVSSTSSNIRGRVLGDFVIDLPTLTKIDEKAGLAADARQYGKIGCTTAVKRLPSGDTVVAHSMDSFYSMRPGYILRTAVPGHLKTIGLSYNPYVGPDFAKVARDGISEKELWPLLFTTTDILNERGLYVEFNMRPGEPEYFGIKKSRGTKPGASESMSILALVRYLGERAGSVAEAVSLAQTVDVHGLSDGRIDWTGALTIADATGRHGVLELVDNRLIWNEGESVQANYVVSPAYKDRALYGTGHGRADVMQKGLAAVANEVQMESLLRKVRFSQITSPYTCPFDVRDEFTGDDSPGLQTFGMTMQEALAEENREYMGKLANQYAHAVGSQSLAQLKREGVQWQSVFQVVANCNKQTMEVMFFENPQTTYKFTVGR